MYNVNFERELMEFAMGLLIVAVVLFLAFLPRMFNAACVKVKEFKQRRASEWLKREFARDEAIKQVAKMRGEHARRTEKMYILGREGVVKMVNLKAREIEREAKQLGIW